MKEIKLTQGKVALVDDEDFEELSKYKWFAKKDKNKLYAIRRIKLDNGKNSTKQMHSMIMGTMKGLQTDHIDGNGLNNQKSNLRICTNYENSMNKGKYKTNTSGLKGVSWDKRKNKWQAEIISYGKRKWLGYFDNKYIAYEIYCKNCKELNGEFAHI